MKYFSSLALVVGAIFAICLQGPSMDSTSSIDSMNVRGGVPVICKFDGYQDIDCAVHFPGVCTSGTFKSAITIPNSTTEDFTFAGSWSVRGNCAGSPTCVTPSSQDLTSVGC